MCCSQSSVGLICLIYMRALKWRAFCSTHTMFTPCMSNWKSCWPFKTHAYYEVCSWPSVTLVPTPCRPPLVVLYLIDMHYIRTYLLLNHACYGVCTCFVDPYMASTGSMQGSCASYACIWCDICLWSMHIMTSIPAMDSVLRPSACFQSLYLLCWPLDVSCTHAASIQGFCTSKACIWRQRTCLSLKHA